MSFGRGGSASRALRFVLAITLPTVEERIERGRVSRDHGDERRLHLSSGKLKRWARVH